MYNIFRRHVWLTLATSIVFLLCCVRRLSQVIASPVGLNGQAILPTLGWQEIPNTQLAEQCPSDPAIHGVGGCRSVIDAWNSAVADTKRDRLILWGGGHTDYYGNEVYGLDLKSLSLSRLTDPSPVTNVNDCPEAYPDGRPSSRHTYGGLVYDPNEDAMFTFGGSKSNCGTMSTAIWKLDLASLKWLSMEPHKGDALYYAPGITSDFDPNSGSIIVSDRHNILRYDPKSNKLMKVTSLSRVDVSYHLSGVIDRDRKLFFMVGWPGQLWVLRINAHGRSGVQDWSRKVTGCEKLLHAPYPGLAYDPARKVVVGWAGGNSVIELNPDTKSCTERSYPGGPGAAQSSGTLGRFRYFPSLGVFALVNDWKQNAFVLRLGSDDRRAR